MSQTSEIVKCAECNRPAKYLLRIGTNRDNWCYAECGVCGDNLCAQHAVDDGEGGFLCDCCAQQLALKGSSPCKN